jgi:hypothetical protein
VLEVLPRIAWKNESAHDATITASSVALGHDAMFAADGTLYRSWQPAAGGDQHLTVRWASPRAISTWCLYGHTLGQVGAGIRLNYWNTTSNSWQAHPAGGQIFPEGGECMYRTGAAVMTTGVQIQITGASAPPRIASFFAGNDMMCERGLALGFVDPQLGQKQVVVHATSRSGLPLPAIVEDEYLQGRFALSNVSLAWAKQTWLPFKRYAQTGPFFLKWNGDTQPAYCSGATFASEAFSQPGHVAVGFSARMATA